MPGKRKKDRKDVKAGKNKAKSNDTPNRGNQPRVTSKAQPKDRKDAPKVFTLKDEAAKSTYRSSKRLWQGEGQKLRNLPVEFVRALEKYDPGQYLREQIEANARKHAEATAKYVPQELSFMKQEPTRLDESIDDPAIVNADTTEINNVKQYHDAFGCQEHESIEKSSNMIATDKLVTSAGEAEAVERGTIMGPLDHEVFDEEHTAHVAATPIEGSSRDMIVVETESMPSASSNIDMVLKNMLEHEDLETDTPEQPAEDQDMSSDLEDLQSIVKTTISQQETPSSTDAELFVVDVEGEALSTDHDPSDNEEILLFRPRQPKESPVEIHTTPWARTINDPVVIDELDSKTCTPPSFVHAFEDKASSKRGKRGGRKKYEKQQAFAKSARRDDIDIMFDYMDNANWTDESDTEEDNEGAEPFINQLLSEISAAGHLQTELVEEGSENEESSSSDSGDDSGIDDDLELMIEAEMEEMEFDLGYTGGRSRKGVRYGADRELVDHALYHEDFNVFQYNSAGENSSADELSASGARKRGLNKFMDDLDLSDEELEALLIAQWKKDRGSKKAKKRDRQRLHKDGVIGKKAKRARMSHEVDTHSSGELDGFHLHIKKFVTHTDYAGIEELPMPAMDKGIRRAVHLLSQAYGLKSASQGSGKRRHITLYKTKHTAQLPDADYLEETLFRARRSLGFNSKYRDTLLPEAAQKKLGRSGKPMRTSRPGGTGPGSRLRDGDLVGADAPEIAIANRGRQMLEKLGWLHGNGLGAVGKEGINLPLFATIKNSKHGLQ